jgi:MoaA/NifB/PqqE/SkfB family radical SAM enzyme
VDFTGGEPLLHPHLDEMLLYAKKIGFRTTVTTNCRFYPSQAKKLSGLVDFLHFSLDSAVSDQHNRLRGAQVFDSVMDSIDIALSINEKPDLLYTVTSENFNQFPLLAEFSQKTGLILLINPVFSHLQKAHLSNEKINQLNDAWHKPFVYVNKAIHNLKTDGGNSRQQPHCRAVTSTLVISPLNELLLPCFHFCQKKINIRGSLLRVHQSGDYQLYIKKQGQFDFCDGCSINCYFDPSFIYKLDRYFLLSLFAKAKYVWDKNIRTTLKRNLGCMDNRPAREILREIVQYSCLKN